MKALIRNKDETITESLGIAGIDWNTGTPLTDAAWAGGPYKLVQNYVPPIENNPETYEEIVEEDVTVTEDTVIIDGKEYTKEELRALLGE